MKLYMQRSLRMIAGLAVIIFAMMAMFLVGCDNKAPAGPVIMAVIPSCEGFTLNHIDGNRFSGPTGKYSLVLLAGIGKVVAGRGSPTDPSQVNYGFNIDEVAPANDAEPGNFIRRITPDSSGLYDLSSVGSYRATAFESDGVGVIVVAECQILTEENFDAPVFHIQSGPNFTQGADWKQIWATNDVITVPFGTFVSIDVISGVVNSLTAHSSVTGEDTTYVEGTSVLLSAGEYRFSANVAKNAKIYNLTLIVRVTPSQ